MPNVEMLYSGMDSNRDRMRDNLGLQEAIATRIARERKLHEIQRFSDLMDSLEPEIAAETAAREEAFKAKRVGDLAALESPGDALLASIEPTVHNQVLGSNAGISDSVATALNNVSQDMYHKQPLLSKITGKMAEGKSIPVSVSQPVTSTSTKASDSNSVNASASQKVVGLAGSRLGNTVADKYGEMLLSAPTPDFKAQVVAEKLRDIRPQILSGSEDPDTMEKLLTGEMERYGAISSGDSKDIREYNKEAMRTSSSLLGKMETSSARKYAADASRTANDAMAAARRYEAELRAGSASEKNRTELIDIFRKSVNDQMDFDAQMFGHKLGYLKSQMVAIYMGKKGIEAFDDLNQISGLLHKFGRANLASLESAISAAGAGDTEGQATAMKSAQSVAANAASSKAYDMARYAELNSWFQNFAARFMPGETPPSETELTQTLSVLKTAVEGLANQKATNLDGNTSSRKKGVKKDVNQGGAKKDLSGGLPAF